MSIKRSLLSSLIKHCRRLSGFEQQDGDLSQIEVNEMLGLVRDVRAEVAANDAVPRWVVLFIEFFLNIGSDVLLDVVLLERLCRTVNCILLHVLGHVRILDHRFSVRHFSIFIKIFFSFLEKKKKKKLTI